MKILFAALIFVISILIIREFYSLAKQAPVDESIVTDLDHRNEEIIVISQKESEEEPAGVPADYWESKEERIRFIRVAMSFLGTPYMPGGATARGMDCSGFTCTLYRIFGLKLPRTAKAQANSGMPVQRGDLEAGDLVFFDKAGGPFHVGIYLGDGTFIHVSTSAKKIRVDFLDTPSQFKHFLGGVRVRELRPIKKAGDPEMR